MTDDICGKICYPSIDDAALAGRKISAREKGKYTMRQYFCNACQAYHLTKVPQKEWRTLNKNRHKKRRRSKS